MNGFQDCHTLRHGNKPHFTYRKGSQESRIDTIWVNEHALAVIKADDLRSAIALRTGPLKSDHMCAMASIPFQVAFSHEIPRVIAITSLTSMRPRRCKNFSQAMSQKFRTNLAAQGEYAQVTDNLLAAQTPQWEQLARALTLSGVDSLTLTPMVIDQAEASCLARIRHQETTRGQNIQNEYKQQIISASQLLRETLGERPSLDLTPQREACFQAVDTWLQGVHSAW